LKNKPVCSEQGKIAKRQTETREGAPGRIIQEAQEKTRKRNVMRQILALRNTLGKMEEDPPDWVRAARRERPMP
jgi:hypothetical protein